MHQLPGLDKKWRQGESRNCLPNKCRRRNGDRSDKRRDGNIMTFSTKSVVVITGAASGIGRALAVRIAQEGIAGIAISDVNEDGLRETAGLVEATRVPVSIHVFDVSNREAVAKFADEIVAKHGRVTHLINNAGVGVIGTFQQLAIEDFEWLMGISFWGVVYCTKAFLPTLLEQESAHIVNV